MAKPIGNTPVLTCEDAERFLEKMNERPTEKDKEIWKRVNSQRHVKF